MLRLYCMPISSQEFAHGFGYGDTITQELSLCSNLHLLHGATTMHTTFVILDIIIHRLWDIHDQWSLYPCWWHNAIHHTHDCISTLDLEKLTATHCKYENDPPELNCREYMDVQYSWNYHWVIVNSTVHEHILAWHFLSPISQTLLHFPSATQIFTEPPDFSHWLAKMDLSLSFFIQCVFLQFTPRFFIYFHYLYRQLFHANLVFVGLPFHVWGMLDELRIVKDHQTLLQLHPVIMALVLCDTLLCKGDSAIHNTFLHFSLFGFE